MTLTNQKSVWISQNLVHISQYESIWVIPQINPYDLFTKLIRLWIGINSYHIIWISAMFEPTPFSHRCSPPSPPFQFSPSSCLKKQATAICSESHWSVAGNNCDVAFLKSAALLPCDWSDYLSILTADLLQPSGMKAWRRHTHADLLQPTFP